MYSMCSDLATKTNTLQLMSTIAGHHPWTKDQGSQLFINTLSPPTIMGVTCTRLTRMLCHTRESSMLLICFDQRLRLGCALHAPHLHRAPQTISCICLQKCIWNSVTLQHQPEVLDGLHPASACKLCNSAT